jgi:hypothetical protein
VAVSLLVFAFWANMKGWSGLRALRGVCNGRKLRNKYPGMNVQGCKNMNKQICYQVAVSLLICCVLGVRPSDV